MNISILVIDDEQTQVANIEKGIRQKSNGNNGVFVITASEEKDILNKIENTFYNLAIVDLRMSKYGINGFDIIKRIKEINPFAKIIVVSAFTQEYSNEINNIISLNNVIKIIDKKSFPIFIEEIYEEIEILNNTLENEDDLTKKSLLDHYAQVKNEEDTYKKGRNFENFISLLFNQIGFNRIMTRVIDKSRNEVDIMIRNEIDDIFFAKFKQYILVECKNYPKDNIGKNIFIEFNAKMQNTSALADLGIIVSSGYIADTMYREAIRNSKEGFKIIFLSNPEIEKLINSSNRLETFKKIIDRQVKDN